MTTPPPLSFGTAGVRAPLGDGPDRMNRLTVTRVATAVARHLGAEHPAGGLVVVGGDARHGSREFVGIVCTVLAAHGFDVDTPGAPVPTPVVAAAVRARSAVAGIQVTASHNPPGDNGVKLFGSDGAQIVPPTDARVEALLAETAHEVREAAAPAGATGATGPDATPAAGAGVVIDPSLVDDYVAAVTAALPRVARPLRVALTPVHGVGGEVCRRVLAGIGVTDVVTVGSQARPDPDFPTVASPNPEHPGTTAPLLELAAEIGADVAIALDPDADRCAMGTRGPDGWHMLDGDSTGVLLAEYLLWPPHDTGPRRPVVASTLVSSRLLSLLAPSRGGRHVETATGFKWLVRAGEPLRYAYEEAIGHCVLPGVVRDKDGISAAAAWCAMVVGMADVDLSPTARLAELHAEFGLHVRDNAAVPLDAGAGAGADAELERIREELRRRFSGAGSVAPLPGTSGFRLDVGGGRVVVRPSGTEPLLKTYCEAWTGPGAGTGTDAAAGTAARSRLDDLVAAVRAAVLAG